MGSVRESAGEWLAVIAGSTVGSLTGEADDGGGDPLQPDLRAVLDAIPAAIMIGLDRDCTRIVCNRAAQKLLKAPQCANLSRSAPAEQLPAAHRVFKAGAEVPLGDLPMQRCALTGEAEKAIECEVWFDDGDVVALSGQCEPIRDSAGQPCGSIGVFFDVTEDRTSLRLAAAISQELSHRLKNTVALIQALAKLTLQPHVDREVFTAFEQRLVQLARYQDLVFKSEQDRVELRQLIEGSILTVAGIAGGRVELDGDDARVPWHLGQNLGMILHELTTNSCKYGSLSSNAGRLTVRWHAAPEGARTRHVLEWVESGGPPLSPTAAPGFGSRLIENLGRALPGGRCQLDFAPDGLRAELVWLV